MKVTPANCVSTLRRRFELMFGIEITDDTRDKMASLQTLGFDDMAMMELDMVVSEMLEEPLPPDRAETWRYYADIETFIIKRVNESHGTASA